MAYYERPDYEERFTGGGYCGDSDTKLVNVDTSPLNQKPILYSADGEPLIQVKQPLGFIRRS